MASDPRLRHPATPAVSERCKSQRTGELRVVLLKIALSVVGLSLIVLGFFDVLRLVRAEQRAEPPILGSSDPESWAELVRAVVELIRASPRWLLLILTGAALIVMSLVI